MDWYPFTEQEKSALLKSWSIIDPNKQSVACNIYEMIFNQCPEARKLFPKMKFSFEKKDSVKKNNEFVFQALRFMQVVEGGVRSLDHLDSLNPILDNLGRRHGKLELSGKFRSYYWSVFLECSIYQIRKSLENSRKFADKDVDGAIILWRLLLRDVMKKIKIGYNADIAHRMSQMSMDDSRRVSLPSIRRNESEVRCPSRSMLPHRYAKRSSTALLTSQHSFHSLSDEPEDDFGSGPRFQEVLDSSSRSSTSDVSPLSARRKQYVTSLRMTISEDSPPSTPYRNPLANISEDKKSKSPTDLSPKVRPKVSSISLPDKSLLDAHSTRIPTSKSLFGGFRTWICKL